MELGIETMKIESGACDLAPEGTEEKSFGKFVKEASRGLIFEFGGMGIVDIHRYTDIHGSMIEG